MRSAPEKRALSGFIWNGIPMPKQTGRRFCDRLPLSQEFLSTVTMNPPSLLPEIVKELSFGTGTSMVPPV